jgi:hypothetical protein
LHLILDSYKPEPFAGQYIHRKASQPQLYPTKRPKSAHYRQLLAYNERFYLIKKKKRPHRREQEARDGLNMVLLKLPDEQAEAQEQGKAAPL